MRSPVRSLLALSALLLPGCRQAPPADPVAGETARRIRLVARNQISMAPLLIAEQEGYFADEGLAIERFPVGSSRDGFPALVRGDLDVVAGLFSTLYLSAAAQGAPIRVVADKGQLQPQHCTSVAFVAPPDRMRNSDLIPLPEGGRFRLSLRRDGIFGLLGDLALRSAGLSPSEVDFVDLRGEVETMAIAQRRVDIGSLSHLTLSRLTEAGEVAVWRAGEDLLPNAQFGVVAFGPSLLERDPESGIRFLIAYLRGVRQYNLGRTERNLTILQEATGYDRHELEEVCWIAIREDGQLDLASLDAMGAWSIAAGRLDAGADIRRVWEPRLVAEAAARLAARDRDVEIEEGDR